VVFITAKSEAEDILQGFEAGCVDYITKPFQQQEVCARVRTHLALRASLSHLRQINEQKNRFLGMAAHDLHSPLSGILGYTEMMMLRDPRMSPEERQSCLKLINATVQRMLSLVNDLLDLSAIERGRLELQPGQHALEELVVERVAIQQIRAELKRITIESKYPPLPRLSFDSNRMTQVLDNLLSNAVKFSPPDSRVEVSVHLLDNAVEVWVQDHGPGLSREEQAGLFGEFHKASSQPTGGEKSTGLGLAIAKKVVEAHGGRMLLESAPGRGAMFGFSLPAE